MTPGKFAATATYHRDRPFLLIGYAVLGAVPEIRQQALLDTGASNCVFGPEEAAAMGLPLTGPPPDVMMTGAGRMHGWLVSIRLNIVALDLALEPTVFFSAGLRPYPVVGIDVLQRMVVALRHSQSRIWLARDDG